MLLAGFGRSHELTDYCTNARGRQIQSSYSVYTGTYSPLATVYIYTQYVSKRVSNTFSKNIHTADTTNY